MRETGGGYTLYWMHFFLHYVPRDVGIRIVGACSMIMLVAILTGITDVLPDSAVESIRPLMEQGAEALRANVDAGSATTA